MADAKWKSSDFGRKHAWVAPSGRILATVTKREKSRFIRGPVWYPDGATADEAKCIAESKWRADTPAAVLRVRDHILKMKQDLAKAQGRLAEILADAAALGVMVDGDTTEASHGN